MSGHPIWITETGSIGVIPEGKFYRIKLQAYDPDFPGDLTKITYSLIAGALPSGVQLDTTGIIEGIPVSEADFKGVPLEVSGNTTSKFTVRATDETNRISDRTFTLTVTGEDTPVFVTPAGSIGSYYDGTILEFQFVATDPDPDDVLTYAVAYGTLPPNTTLSTDGLLSGFLQPIPSVAGATQGFDITTFDQYGFDFQTVSGNYIYQFTIQVSDGKTMALRTFTIEILNNPQRVPYIRNYKQDLGSYRHNNYFMYEFDGVDPDGETIEYKLGTQAGSFIVGQSYEIAIVNDTDFTLSGAVDNNVGTTFVATNIGTGTGIAVSLDGTIGDIPPNTALLESTGWLEGTLADISATTQQHQFIIIVRKVDNPTIMSLPYVFDLEIFGNIEDVSWITDSYLGSINNGQISTFAVEATHATETLQYRLVSGEYNKLPQGLKLEPSGDIIGQVTFNTFALDGGTTTFDSDYNTRLSVEPTTFDSRFVFHVEAFYVVGVTEVVSTSKEFIIDVDHVYNEPHNVLYCVAMPSQEDRDFLDSLLKDTTIFTDDIIYRKDDPNFGVASRVKYNHAYGLSPATFEAYYAALVTNHYNKSITLGELKTARALDSLDNVVYEVVYSEIKDELINPNGESISSSIIEPVSGQTLYPNSLVTMREQVVSLVGQSSKDLPRWMLSKQDDGKITGFIPVWVIAYTQPGGSKLLKYRIDKYFNKMLNVVNFDLDRYELDFNMSKHWDIDAGKWITGSMVTFDRTDPYITPEPIVYPTIPDQTYDKPKVLTPYDIVSETIFDGGSCRFVSPVDVYNGTDEYDKYIKFPKRNILQ